MAVTLYNPRVFDAVPWVRTPLVYLKQDFGEGWTFKQQQAQFGVRFGKDWTLAPDVELIEAQVQSVGQGLDYCHLRRPYGFQKQPWQRDIEQAEPYDLRGWWVCLMFGEYLQATRRRGTSEPGWIGRIYNAPVNSYSGEAGALSGVQDWTAYGPLRELELIDVDFSIWVDLAGAPVKRTLYWLPSMNLRDGSGMTVGNRSEARHFGSYVFGGNSLWTHYDFLEYVLTHYVGGSWSLGGQANLLQTMISNQTFGSSTTVADIFDALIPPSSGLDYRIVWRNAGAEPGQTWNAGWVVEVFSLLPQPVSFGSTTLPANPNRIRVDLTTQRDIETVNLVPSQEFLYNRIAVIGRRVVVCCTVKHEARIASGGLINGWTQALEDQYKAGTGTPGQDAKWHDAARRRDLFRNVYRYFRVPSDWNQQAANASPKVGWNGFILDPATDPADYQNWVRRTLPWTPLLEGWDYSVWPPVNQNPANQPADQLPPQAWFASAAGGFAFWSGAENFGISISVPRNDLGVYLGANPNHLLAFNQFSGAEPTEVDPLLDYSYLQVTLAFESGRRAALNHEVDPEAGGLWKVIEVPGAELWYLAPETVVGVDASENLQTSGPTFRELRNDLPLLELAMAGALARYTRERNRADLRIRGLFPFGNWIGQILQLDSGFGDLTELDGPVTTVAWQPQGQPKMMIKTTFAL